MRKPSTDINHEAFLKKTNSLLLVVLFIMIAGFFTWSENVNITRVIKVIGRIGMTIASYMIYRRVIKYGAVGSFSWRNSMSPILYTGYLLLGLVSFLWSTNVGYSSLQWIMDIEGYVFAFFFIRTLFLIDAYFPNNNIRFYNLMGNVAFMIMLIFVIGSIIAPDTYFRKVEGGEDSRLGGYIMNPNELGMFCGLGISCLIFDLYRKKNKWWTFFKLAILAYTFIITKSRSSLVGLLLIIFFHIRNNNNGKLEILVYVGVIAALPVAIQSLVMRKGGIDDVLSMTGRMPFWQALISEALPNEPLFGFGFMRIYYEETFQGLHTYRAHMTHNTFIQVLMNLGFVGFTLVAFQMFFTIKAFLKEEKEKKLMLIGILIPIVINSFTEFGIFGETNYGILFYELLIFLISTKVNMRLTPVQKLYLKKRRPDFVIPPPPPLKGNL